MNGLIKSKKIRFCYCGNKIRNSRSRFCSRKCYFEYKGLKKEIDDSKLYTQYDIINMSADKLARDFQIIFCHYCKLNEREEWKFKGWKNIL